MHRIQSKSEKLTEQDLMEFYFATGIGVSTWNLLARVSRVIFFSFSSYEMPEVLTLPVQRGVGMIFQRFSKHNSA